MDLSANGGLRFFDEEITDGMVRLHLHDPLFDRRAKFPYHSFNLKAKIHVPLRKFWDRNDLFQNKGIEKYKLLVSC